MVSSAQFRTRAGVGANTILGRGCTMESVMDQLERHAFREVRFGIHYRVLEELDRQVYDGAHRPAFESVVGRVHRLVHNVLDGIGKYGISSRALS